MDNNHKVKLRRQIENLRSKLLDIGTKKAKTDQEVIELSQKLDSLINQYLTNYKK